MPLISVVIPTRNRLEYLQDAVKSALDQASPDMEIIVADNATDDGTEAYLASLGAAVKVTRSAEALSMTDNWYRALELVTGEWVIFIGDDDCLMPDFVNFAKKAIIAYPQTELFHWEAPIYRWPEAVNPLESNYLQFALGSHTRKTASREVLRKMFEEIVSIMAPPGLYHCLSKTSLMQRAKDKLGEFRVGIVPDFGSGVLYLALTDSYIILPRPLTVMGFSPKSTGMAFKNGDKDFGARAEFNKLSRLSDLKVTYPLMDIDTADVYQWRLLLDWRQYFEERGLKFTFNNDKMFGYCLSRLNKMPEGERQDAAVKLIEYGVAGGMPRELLETEAKKSLARASHLSPHHSITKDGEVTTLRLGCDLTKTPIRTATGAAGLIHGYLRR